jgi:hypothetical protein
MADQSRTIDEIELENACHKKCREGLSACLEAWREFDKRNPKADPRIARLGMLACSDAHFIADGQCGRGRRHFPDALKRGFYNASLASFITSGVSAIGGMGAVTLFAAPVVGGFLIGFGAACAVVGWTIALLDIDPNDPNFTEVPVPSFPKLPPIRPVPNTGLTASVADAANAVMANQAEAIGLLNALITALNRSDGAAEAGDKNAEKRQLKAARDFAKNLAKVFKNAAPLRSALASKWKGPDLDFSISTRKGLKLVDELMVNGSPPLVDTLKKLGASQKDRDVILQRMIGELGKVRNFPRFRELLKDRKLRAAEVGLTRSFEQFSRSE